MDTGRVVTVVDDNWATSEDVDQVREPDLQGGSDGIERVDPRRLNGTLEVDDRAATDAGLLRETLDAPALLVPQLGHLDAQSVELRGAVRRGHTSIWRGALR